MARMLRRALRAYPGQAAVLGAICFVLAAIGLAAPAYARLAAAQLRVAQVAAASPVERSVTVRAEDVFDSEGDRGKADRAVEKLKADADRAGLTEFVTLQLVVRARTEGAQITTTLVSRDAACDHVQIDGRCPTAAGEVLLGRSAAEALKAGKNSQILVRVAGSAGVLDYKFTVTGLYTAPDSDGYWSTRTDMTSDPRRTDTPILAAKDTLLGVATSKRELTQPITGGTEKEAPAGESNGVTVTPIIDLMAFDAGRLPTDLAQARADLDELRQSPPAGFTAFTQMPEFFDRIEASERALGAGIAATAGGVIVVGGFVLLLAAWYAAAQRASKTTLAVLRGTPAFSRWWFAAGPSALVALIGAVLGAVAGRLLVRTPLSIWDGVFLGGVLAVVAVGVLAVEARALRLPVLTALRQAHPASAGRRVDPLDLLALAAAAVMVYQLATGAPDRGIAPLGPPLIVLAVALLAGRGLTAVTAALSGQRLRRGDLATGLAAAHISRRSSAPRLFALLIVAVALVGLALTGYDTTSVALHDRARLDLGADRVLTVTGSSYTRVRTAVQSADPSGRWLLAAARDAIGTSRIVAVQSDRLARVADWSGADAAGLAGLLHPAANPPVSVDGSALVLDVTVANPSAVPTPVSVNLTDAAGEPIRVTFPIVDSGRYAQPLAGCARGCRLAYIGFEHSPDGLHLAGLTQHGPDRVVLDGKALASPGRFRDGFTTQPGELTVLHGDEWLSAHYEPDDPRHISTDLRVLMTDMPVPLPVVAAGTPAVAQTDIVRHLPILSADVKPVRLSAAVAGLPGAGADGYLIDLEYADRLAGDGLGEASAEIWARGDTPEAVLAAVRSAVTITNEETVAQRQDLMMRTGPGQSARFRLVMAALGVLLAAGGLAVAATAEHHMRLAELRDLRRQGLGNAVAVRTVARSFAILVGAGIAAGVFVGFAAVAGLANVTIPVFIDTVARPATATGIPVFPGWGISLAGLAGVLVVLGGAGAYAARRLARALRAESPAATAPAVPSPDLVGAAR